MTWPGSADLMVTGGGEHQLAIDTRTGRMNKC